MEITNTQDDEANVAYREFMGRVGKARGCAAAALLLAAAGLGWTTLLAALESLSGGPSVADAGIGFLQGLLAWIPAIVLVTVAHDSFNATDQEYAAQDPQLGSALTSARTLIQLAGWAIALSVVVALAPLLQSLEVGGVSSY